MNEVMGLDDLALWSMVLGFMAPPIVSIATRPAMQSWAKIAILATYSFIAGFGTVYLQGALEGRALLSSVLLVMVTAMVTYRNVWKPTGVAPVIEAGVFGGDSDTAVELPEPEETDPQDQV